MASDNLNYHAYYGNKRLTLNFGFPEVLNKQEKNKMVYDANKGKKGEDKPLLPVDTILDGVVTKIEDGKLPDFVQEQYLKSWSGDKESSAIQLTVECEFENEKKETIKVDFTQLFTYFDEDGETVYTPKSNLGKFVAKYEKLPVEGFKVKVISNKDGFGKIKLE